MTYCANCGIIIETYDCPVCGWTNFQPVNKNAPESALLKPRPQNGAVTHGACGAKYSALFITGGIGAVLVAVAAVLLAVIPILNMVLEGDLLEFSSEEYYYLEMIGAVTFLIGGILMASGFLGLFVHYHVNSGLAAVVFTILGAVMLFVFTIVALNHETWSSYSYYDHYYWHSEYRLGWSVLVGHLFAGLMAVVMGASLVASRRKTASKELSGAAGALCILSGGLLFGLMGLTGIAWTFLAVSSVLASMVFFTARPNNGHTPQPTT